MQQASITALQQQLQQGLITASSMTQYYLDRIAALNRQGPALNAVLECNPDALQIAESLDQERINNGPRSLLHGIPVLIKDNIDTADKMSTTAGSLALENSVATQDAYMVQQLRQAGAVILGKTNLSEWANFRSTRSSSGWSSRGGQTRNPYVLDRSPGGSSSGSGVAVAADLCTVAIGTETDGSISSPAAMNSLVGIKPTVGLLSRSGIIPISYHQDTAGPMSRCVSDAAIVLGILAGQDDNDALTADCQNPADYTPFLDAQGLRGARIGVVRQHWPNDHHTEQILDNSITTMRDCGADIIDSISFLDSASLRDNERQVMLHEFKTGLNTYLEQLGEQAPQHSLADIIEFNRQHQERVMPYFQQELLLAAQATSDLTGPLYQQALQRNLQQARQQGIDKTLQQDKLDAIIMPTTSAPWLIDCINGDNRSGSAACLPAVAGYPHITVPAGYVFGLPVGLSFIGGAYQEPLLIKLAYAFEQATQIRQAPTFQTTINF